EPPPEPEPERFRTVEPERPRERVREPERERARGLEPEPPRERPARPHNRAGEPGYVPRRERSRRPDVGPVAGADRPASGWPGPGLEPEPEPEAEPGLDIGAEEAATPGG